MPPTVTAVVVVSRAGDHLDRALAAIRDQTRPADAVIAVDCAADPSLPAALADAGATHVVSARERLPFGAAIGAGLDAAAPPPADHHLYWLLDQECAPDPLALENLLAALEVSASVGIAGPKLVDADERGVLRGLGETMTPFGASVALVEGELDQGQHDHLSDVLGVASAGVLVRSTLWERLGGFDQGLPVVDDGLDLSVRARLCGYRVVVVPTACVAVTSGQVSGTTRAVDIGRRSMSRRRRAAQLHRRMVYAPGLLLPVHWLSLVPLAIVRSLIRLLRKQPGAIGGELAAAFLVAFALARVTRARGRMRRARTVGFAAIAPLRIRHADARRMRAMARESAQLRSGLARTELRFFRSGGLWVVVAMAVLSVAAGIPLIGGTVLSGGGLLRLGEHVGHLWTDLGVGWRDVGAGFVGPADPFSAVLAVLGSVTFWNPSLSLVLLWLLAMPLAALGAWLAAARITERGGLRAAAAVLWAIAPPLLSAMQLGRPSAVLLHLLLPWLVFAGARAMRSWAAAAATALISAAALACAPSLWPAFAVIWAVALLVAGRRAARLVAIPIPALVLFAPLAARQWSVGHWLAVFADPGAPVAATDVPVWHLLLGFPSENLGGWASLLDTLGISGLNPAIFLPALLAPVALLALVGAYLHGATRAALWIGTGLVGLATAVVASTIQLTTVGPDAVSIFSGNGLSLYWLGATGAMVMGAGALSRLPVARPARFGAAATALCWVAVVAVGVAVVPAGAALPMGTSHVSASGQPALPAVVEAEATTNPRVGTLRMQALANGALSAQLLRGAGDTLERQSTLAQTTDASPGKARSLARLAGNLASRSGMDASPRLRALGIGFVLLAPPQQRFGHDATTEATATDARASAALAGTVALQPVASTGLGHLYSFEAGHVAVPPEARVPAHPAGVMRPVVFVILIVVFGSYLLLALPTGRWAEPQETRSRRKPRRARRTRAEKPEQEPSDPEPKGNDPVAVEPGAGDPAADESCTDAPGTDTREDVHAD